MRLDNNLLRGDDEDFSEKLDMVVRMSVALRPDDLIFHESVAEYVKQAIERELAKAG